MLNRKKKQENINQEHTSVNISVRNPVPQQKDAQVSVDEIWLSLCKKEQQPKNDKTVRELSN